MSALLFASVAAAFALGKSPPPESSPPVGAQSASAAPAAAIWLVSIFFLLNRLRDVALLSAPIIEQYKET